MLGLSANSGGSIVTTSWSIVPYGACSSEEVNEHGSRLACIVLLGVVARIDSTGVIEN